MCRNINFFRLIRNESNVNKQLLTIWVLQTFWPNKVVSLDLVEWCPIRISIQSNLCEWFSAANSYQLGYIRIFNINCSKLCLFKRFFPSIFRLTWQHRIHRLQIWRRLPSSTTNRPPRCRSRNWFHESIPSINATILAWRKYQKTKKRCIQMYTDQFYNFLLVVLSIGSRPSVFGILRHLPENVIRSKNSELNFGKCVFLKSANEKCCNVSGMLAMQKNNLTLQTSCCIWKMTQLRAA